MFKSINKKHAFQRSMFVRISLALLMMLLISAPGLIMKANAEADTVVADTSKKYYSKSTGNVRDAIYFLSRHSDYTGIKFRQARKSTGLFSTKVVEGVYVAVPQYTNNSENRPPEYRFTEKDGNLTVRIRPVIRPMSN